MRNNRAFLNLSFRSSSAFSIVSSTSIYWPSIALSKIKSFNVSISGSERTGIFPTILPFVQINDKDDLFKQVLIASFDRLSLKSENFCLYNWTIASYDFFSSFFWMIHFCKRLKSFEHTNSIEQMTNQMLWISDETFWIIEPKTQNFFPVQLYSIFSQLI